MDDTRFFENHGPFTLAQICEKAGIAVPAGANAGLLLHDLADLAGAAPQHLTFFSGAAPLREAFAAARAGACFVAASPSPRAGKRPPAPAGMVLLEVPAIGPAFAAVAAMFYPAHSQPRWAQAEAVSQEARLGKDVELAPGVVIAPGVEIGDGTRLGPGAVIGPGV